MSHLSYPISIYTMAVLTLYQSHKRSHTLNSLYYFRYPDPPWLLGQSDAGPELNRRERDGGSHHMAHGRRRSGRQNGRLRQQPRQNRRQRPQQNQRRPPQQSFRKKAFQEVRGGRQSGATGLALGVVNNTPTQDGSYNFK